MSRSAKGFPIRVLVLALATFACSSVAPTPVRAEEACSTARIRETFVLPDGQEFSGGRLSFCPGGAYSPVALFHEVRVDGRPVGILLSHRATNTEARAHGVLIIFNRDADRRLHLLGYAVPAGDRAALYGFFSLSRPA